MRQIITIKADMDVSEEDLEYWFKRVLELWGFDNYEMTITGRKETRKVNKINCKEVKQ